MGTCSSKLIRLFCLIGGILCVSFNSFDWKKLDHRIREGKPPVWMLEQIQEDLQAVSKTGITREMLDQTMKQDLGDLLFARISIKKGQVSITFADSSHWDSEARRQNLEKKSSVNFEYRKARILETLQHLARHCSLPDVDFVLCLDDCLFDREFPGPVFAFAKNRQIEKKVILFPDYDAVIGYQDIFEELSLGKAKYPWEKKVSKAYWRGATTGKDGKTFSVKEFLKLPRAKTVDLSLKHPELINAKLTVLAQCQEPKKLKSQFTKYFAKYRAIHKHLKYKYQILIDGNTAAFNRAYWQLFSECPILKQESPHIQWYFRLLQPDIHYISLKSDLSDLSEKILWLKNHDTEAYQIGQNAFELAQKNLKHEDILYYIYVVLHEYAKLQKP